MAGRPEAQTARSPDPAPLALREHLANERTFLAWLRTALGILAFGLLLERGALIEGLLEGASRPSLGATGIAGTALIAFGLVMLPLSVWRFLQQRHHIGPPFPPTSLVPVLALTIALLITACVLLVVAVRG